MSATEFYTLHSDPGHAWLEVPLHTCKGLDISSFSYTDGVVAYLEEDCDAPLWMCNYNIPSRRIQLVHHNDECYVRGLPVYRQED